MVRVGVIGAGGIARASCEELAAHPDAEIIAVADPNQESASEFALRYDTIRTMTAEPEILLAMPEVDAVYIATPNHLHMKFSKMALRAGKHVLQEKPLARNLEEALSLADLVHESDVHFMLGMNQRFSAEMQYSKQLIERDRIGRVYHCKAYWRRRSGIPRIGSWFTQKNLSGGGGLLDIGVHMLDNTLYLLNNFLPHSVSGSTYREFGSRGLGDGRWGQSIRSDQPFDVDDFATAIIKLEGGVTILLEAAWAMHMDCKSEMNVELHGTDGAIDTYRQRLYFQKDDGYHAVEFPNTADLKYPHTSRMHHFIDVVLGREELCVTIEQAIAVQSIIDAIYKSSDTGQEVILN